MNKDNLMKFLKENTVQLSIIAGGLVLSIVLQAVKGNSFWNGLGILFMLATIGYASFVIYRISQKAKAIIEEKAKEKRAQEEAEKKEKAQQAMAEFKASIDLSAELDHILSVIRNNPTRNAFEQGIEPLLKKTNTQLSQEQVRQVLLEVLVARFVACNGMPDLKDPATVVLSSYFARNMYQKLVDDFVMVVNCENHAKSADSSFSANFWQEKATDYRIPFIKNLYAFSAHAWNFIFCLENGGYAPLDDSFLLKLIESDSVLKSYCEANPFEAEEKKREWLADIRKAVYNAVDVSGVKFDVTDNEQLLDMLCYLGYFGITQKESKSLDEIVNDIYETAKPHCEEMAQRIGR